MNASNTGPDPPTSERNGCIAEPTWVVGNGLEPGDAYEEGPYIVFTAQYHLRRGHCCHSDCRHCPYREG